MSQRTIVVGDVHGCLTEFDELLAIVAFRPGRDRLVLVGDLMDRGPDPVGVVRRARELRVEGVLGNHDEKHLRWRAHEERRRVDPRYKNPMRPLSEAARTANEALDAEDLAYLAALPAYLRLDGQWLVVHAGFASDRPIEQQNKNVLLRIRYVDAAGRFASLSSSLEAPDGAVPWPVQWRGPESVIYGHAPQLPSAVPRIDRPLPGVCCYGIDTGCCFGGRLTALILPTCDILQVNAREAYARVLASEDDD